MVVGPIGDGGGAMGGTIDKPPTPTVAHPSWMDARYVTEVSYTRDETVPIGAGQTLTAIGNDPTRWAIGFVAALTNTAPVRISPKSTPGVFPLFELAAGEAQWLPLSQFGTLVTYEWYAQCAAAASLLVIIVKLQ